MLTPEQVHFGQAEAVVSQRQLVLEAAYAAHPERFVNGHPHARSAPLEAWINKPEVDPDAQ